MKTTLLALLCIALLSSTNIFAQPCDLSNVQLEKVYTGAEGKCFADVSFDMNQNNGNKFVYLHFWTNTDFSKVEVAKFSNGPSPKYSDINGTQANPHPALATIAIDNEDNKAPVWSSFNYRPDASVTVVTGSSLHVSATRDNGNGSNAIYRYSLKGIPLGSACSAEAIAVMVWSSQSNNIKSLIHCSLAGPSSQQALVIEGAVQCAVNKYNLTITNPTDKVIAGSIDLFADNGNGPNDGTFNSANDRKFDAISYFTVEPNQTLTISRAIPDNCLGYNLFAEIVHSIQYTQVARMLATSCGTLPVVLKDVSATRIRQQVAIEWKTASEQAVRGFNVLRQSDHGGWKVIGFVPSKAAGGYSSQLLSYQYMDVNPSKGISEYRIQEISNDGKTTISEVKIVRGDEQAAKLTIYPNPSNTGKAVVAFDNSSVRDIIVSDVSGRIVRQLKSVSAGNVTIDQLNDGFYNVQVIDRKTNESKVTRLIVKH